MGESKYYYQKKRRSCRQSKIFKLSIACALRDGERLKREGEGQLTQDEGESRG